MFEIGISVFACEPNGARSSELKLSSFARGPAGARRRAEHTAHDPESE